MIKYISLLFCSIIFVGCIHQEKIDIGNITVDNFEDINNSLERYLYFTQEFFENRDYPINRYCQDKRAILTDNKFSTEIYIKVINRRTKIESTSKYPIWFLINDDSSNIWCVRRSSNFITKEPIVVNGKDRLTLKILQKNREQKSVPVRELEMLLNVASFIMPYGSSLFLKGSNLIKDQNTKEYLNRVEQDFNQGGMFGIRTKEFDINTKSIKIELIVPKEENEYKNLGYIILKPSYRKTLSTVNLIEDTPNFKDIYSINDPRVDDIMSYELKSLKTPISKAILEFKKLKEKDILEKLNSLNIHLINHFTSYDRALILSLALKNTNLYRDFKESIEKRDEQKISKYLNILNRKDNPLNHLIKILEDTNIEYIDLIKEANRILKDKKEKKKKINKEENSKEKREED